MQHHRAIALAAMLLVTGAARANAQDTQDAPRSGSQILERYHAAIGGLPAFAAVQSLHSTGELSIPSAGIGGTVEIWQGRPNRTVMRVEVPGFGEVRSGYTGAAGWSMSTVEGPRLMTGAEALQAADEAHFDSLLRTSELVDSLVFVERTTMAGQACDRVRVIWKTGRMTNDCFAVDTGLLIGSVRTQLNGTTPLEATILYDEYREVGAIRIPTRITTRVQGIDQVITLRDVTLDQVSDAALDPPPAVRALIRG